MFYVVMLISYTALTIKLKCFNLRKSWAAKREKKPVDQSINQSMSNHANNFEGIHVSKGFVRGLQGQVLKLEQMHQSLIRQLDHANKLASEYHATAVTYQRKYDAALHETSEMRHAFERETLLRISRERDLEHFKNLLQEQLAFRSNSSSPSPDHPHHHSHEPMSPVSVASPSPSPRPLLAARLQTQGSMALCDTETPNEDEYHDPETKRKFQTFYESSDSESDYYPDPICHSDTDSN